MSMRVQIPMKATAAQARSIRAAQSAILRRKCACGGSGDPGGQCAECEKKKLQRSGAGQAPEFAPHIVHEVLRAPGEPLDARTRAYFEARFGHDFSKVRLHADAEAAESARAVNALAYTVGRDIVFANRPSVPGTAEGTRILAHELTHVLQQSGSDGSAGLRVGSIDSPFEREADQAASAVLSNQHSAPTVHAGTPALQRQQAQKPAQIPGQTQADPVWESKKWRPFENAWNDFYQFAIQGLAGGSLKPEQLPKLAKMIADDAMVLCFKHGHERECAKAAAQDQETKTDLDVVLTWGSTGPWGRTFGSALQSTTQNVNGPITAGQAVQRAGDIADRTARGMLSNSAWQLYMNCKTPNAPSSTSPPPQKTAASGAH